jgi:hypothetical protein
MKSWLPRQRRMIDRNTDTMAPARNTFDIGRNDGPRTL